MSHAKINVRYWFLRYTMTKLLMKIFGSKPNLSTYYNTHKSGIDIANHIQLAAEYAVIADGICLRHVESGRDQITSEMN